MPTLETLREGTTPVTMIGGDDPLIFHVKNNCKTPSCRQKIRDEMKSITDNFVEANKQVEKLVKEAAQLDKSEVIEAKRAELDGLDENDAAREKPQGELDKLLKAQEKAEPELKKIAEKMSVLAEQAAENNHELLARHIAFMVASTNVRQNEAPDSPLVAADETFFRETFDSETLRDFSHKISEALEGPLANRLSISPK